MANRLIEPIEEPAGAPVVAGTAAPRFLMTAALAVAAVLVAASVWGIPDRMHIYLSALPLALAGVAYAALQIALRPPRGTLLKRLLLAATFTGWAVDQMLPPGRVAVVLGDLVIAAYVLDLYWMVREQSAPRP